MLPCLLLKKYNELIVLKVLFEVHIVNKGN